MTGIGVTDMPTFADIDGQRPFSRAAEAQPDRVTMRLLVIEDDRDAADYLVKAFREVGHVADSATDGDDGLTMAADGQYDVLIVDQKMPELTGAELVQTLRDRGHRDKVIVVSALVSSDIRETYDRLDVHDIFTKPFNVDELRSAVDRLAA